MAAEEGASLETTPTWAVAIVFIFMVTISIFMEHALHLLSKYLNKRRRKALSRGLDQIKSELMLMGFISLFLTVCERPIAKICISKTSADNFRPCQSHFRYNPDLEEAKCSDQGKISLVSRTGIRELQHLLFIFAGAHVISCFLTFTLGMLKMRSWETWEEQTKTLDYQFSNDPRRVQLIHQTTFGRRHLGFWSERRLFRLPASFIRQFYESVSRVDYLTLRHGFITAHFDGRNAFDFQKYLQKTLDKDFGVVVAVSPWIWMVSILFVFFNAHLFRTHVWFPFIPLVMLLVVGTKLQGIITNMCLDSSDKSLVVRGPLMLVRPSDHFFWFHKPKLLLHLIHFILVQNSFQMAFFAWSWAKFGLRSCFHHNTEDIVVKIVIGLIVQFLCGYVTLPLYALVTQMGSSVRKDHVFQERVIKGLRSWKKRAKRNIAKRNNVARSLDTSLETSLTSSPSHSTRDHHSSILFHEHDNHSISDDGIMEISIVDDYENKDVADDQRQLDKSISLGSFRGFHP